MVDIYTKFNIDKSKLTRDYIINPLNLIPMKNGGYTKESPDKRDIEYLYLELNLSIKNISEYFNVSVTPIHKWFKKYGIKKDKKKVIEIYKNTNLERYGVEVPSQNKDIKEKTKRTCLERYGTEYVSQVNEFKEKIKQTNLERYGVEYAAQNKEIFEKVKQTKLQKYGDENFNNKLKSQSTCISRYNCNNPSKKHISEDIYEILSNRYVLENYIKDNNIRNATDLANKWGVSPSFIANYIHRYDLYYMFDYSKSSKEKELQEYISKKYDIECNTRKYLDGQELDIYIPNIKVGIEFNGDYWHDYLLFPNVKERDDKKRRICEEKGIKLITIWEHDWDNNKEQIKCHIDNELNIIKSNSYCGKTRL